MPQTPRFHLDESVTKAIADGLRLRERDCTTTPELGMLGASDEEQLAYAKREGRILITSDQDFLALIRDDTDHPGVVYYAGRRHFGQVVTHVDELCFAMSAKDFRGKTIYL